MPSSHCYSNSQGPCSEWAIPAWAGLTSQQPRVNSLGREDSSQHRQHCCRGACHASLPPREALSTDSCFRACSLQLLGYPMQINTPVFASTSQMPVPSHLFLNPLHLGRCSLCISDALNNSDVLRTVEHRGLDGPPHQLKIKSSELYKSVTPFEAKEPPWGLE